MKAFPGIQQNSYSYFALTDITKGREKSLTRRTIKNRLSRDGPSIRLFVWTVDCTWESLTQKNWQLV